MAGVTITSPIIVMAMVLKRRKEENTFVDATERLGQHDEMDRQIIISFSFTKLTFLATKLTFLAFLFLVSFSLHQNGMVNMVDSVYNGREEAASH